MTLPNIRGSSSSYVWFLSYMATTIQVDFRSSEMGWNHQPVSQKQLDPQHCLSPDPWHDPVARMALPESTGWIWLMSSTISMTGPYKVNLYPISGMHISPCKVLPAHSAFVYQGADRAWDMLRPRSSWSSCLSMECWGSSETGTRCPKKLWLAAWSPGRWLAEDGRREADWPCTAATFDLQANSGDFCWTWGDV